jgi:phage terminase large subunit
LPATETNVFTKEQLDYELASYIADFGDDYGTARFEQEYLCSFDSANMGAILAQQLGKLEQRGLINDDVSFDPLGSEIFISADIGRRDSATWYFWQPKIGGYAIIDYDGGWGIDADEWCHRLQEKISKYKLANGKPALGKIWLPHDARAKTFAAKHSAQEIFIKNFGPSHVDITPGSSISDRVQAARKIVQRCEFNATNCEKGLEGLRAWSYEYDDKAKIFSSQPLHDWASHDGDGFSYGCLIMSLYKPPEELVKKPVFPIQMTIQQMIDKQRQQRDEY